MLSTTITESEMLAQSAELLEAMFSLMAHVDFDLRCGAFDDDKEARAQVAELMLYGRQCCGELLQAWPESIAM